MRTARTHDVTFGIIPPSSAPESIMASSSSTAIDETRVVGSFASLRRPSTLVRYTSFSAPSASATAPAAVSALML